MDEEKAKDVKVGKIWANKIEKPKVDGEIISPTMKEKTQKQISKSEKEAKPKFEVKGEKKGEQY